MLERVVSLIRIRTSDQGTEGRVTADGVSLFSLELPWRQNRPIISCIPNGKYDVFLRQSSKFGKTYCLKDVPGREYILIHSANWAGDTEMGFKTHLNGCIAFGLSMGFLQGQRAVLNSRVAIAQFMEYMQLQPFVLQVIGGDFNVS